MKIDIHAHILPETWPDLKQRYGYDGFIYLDHHKKGAARIDERYRAVVLEKFKKTVGTQSNY